MPGRYTTTRSAPSRRSTTALGLPRRTLDPWPQRGEP
jgi:hypothetical protein